MHSVILKAIFTSHLVSGQKPVRYQQITSWQPPLNHPGIPLVLEKCKDGKQWEGDTTMGYRNEKSEGTRNCREYTPLEVVIMRKGVAASMPKTKVVLVAGDRETLDFVRQNMDQFVGNVVRLNRMEERHQRLCIAV
jgi:hypothetical protein